MGEAARDLAAAYLLLFEGLRKEAEAAGHPIQDYKPTDRACVHTVFAWLLASDHRGFGFLVDVVHELVWGQCLANANHRTAFLLTEGLLEQAGIENNSEWRARTADAFDRFADASKRVFEKRLEFGYGAGKLKEHHREATVRFLETLGLRQSRHVATIGPHSLRSAFQ